MKRSWLRLVAPLLVLAVVAAACGDDDDEETKTGGTEATSSTTEAETGTTGDQPTDLNAAMFDVTAKDPLAGAQGTGLTRGVSDSTIKIGCFYTAAAFAGADDGYRARFERVNGEGGINGRKIDFSACQDDGANTQQNLQIARRLVEQDKVFAVMSISANTLPGTTDYLSQQQVPYYGWGFTPGFCGHRWGFGFNGCLIGDSLSDSVPHAVVQGNLADTLIKGAGGAKADLRVAFQAGDDDAGHAGNSQYNRVYEDRGVEVVYDEANLPVPGPPSDFSPFVRAVLDAKPNAVITSTNFQTAPGFTAALKAGGYTGFNMNFVAYVPGLLKASAQLAQALDGAYVNTQIVPQEGQTEYIKQLEDDLVAINAKNGKFILFGAAIAYAQADLLVQQLEAVGETLDTKTFDEGINGGDFVSKSAKDGGPGSLGWPGAHFLPADCAALLKVEGDAYTPVLPFTCYKSVRVR